MKNFFSQNQGFTLVELLTVVAMVCIISGIAAANYRLGDRRVVLDNQAAQLDQDFRRAQEWALSSREINGTSPAGYGVYAPGTGGYYILYADSDGNKKYSGESEIVEKIFLDGKIEISACQPSPADINYTAPDLAVKITNGAGAGFDWARITFRIKGGAQTRVIAANAAGLVYVE
jgi:prepilin-type N-terminal cleavage/methylation domain-containing protein